MRCVSRHFLSRGRRGVRRSSEAAESAAGHAGHCLRGTGIRAGDEAGAARLYARRKGEHGSAILESFLSMILLGMILFGVLQLFQLVLADMLADYAAFRGARSAAVGFNERLAKREALTKSVPASGSMVFPDPSAYAGYQFGSVETEKALLRRYMECRRDVEYANWIGKERFHMNYQCPSYGEPLTGGCALCSTSGSTHVNTDLQHDNEHVRFRFEFIKFPLNLPLHDWLTGRDTVDIRSDSEDDGWVELTNHSAAFLE